MKTAPDPLRQLVIEFSPDKKRVIDYDEEFKDQAGYLETEYLTRTVLAVQTILRKLFFGPAADRQPTEEYLVRLIEEL